MTPLSFVKCSGNGKKKTSLAIQHRSAVQMDDSNIVMMLFLFFVEEPGLDQKKKSFKPSPTDSVHLAATVMKHRLKGIMVTDTEGQIQIVNEAFTRITGYSEEEIIGKTPEYLYSGHQGAIFYERMWNLLLRDGKWQGEIWNRRKNGTIYPEWLSLSAIENQSAQVTHYVGVFSDITERTLSEERLFHLAYHDILTGLPNRRLLTDRLAQEIKQVERSQQKLALLQIDLDQFKAVSDIIGHPASDALLVEVAQRLKEAVRDCDTVSRLSKDSFIILLTESSEIEHTATIAQKILNSITKPTMIDERPVILSGSIGISLYPADGTDCETLLEHVNRATSRVKAEGKNGYQFYSEAMSIASLERIALKMAIQRALDRGEFHVYYQPKMDLKTGKISSVEALSRWQHPEKGLILPAAFIPMAEETSQILAIGVSVLRTACHQTENWQKAGLPPFGLSVNLSARQFQQENLVSIVIEALQESGLNPSTLELEITESAALEDLEKGIATMNELRHLGVKLAIDDFGIGYASLGYIRKLPIHTLKIDQSFIKNLTVNESDKAITAAIIAMAHSLNLNVVAEGVETEGQLAFLEKLQCDQMQGYLLSRPLPADLLEGFLKQRG